MECGREVKQLSGVGRVMERGGALDGCGLCWRIECVLHAGSCVDNGSLEVMTVTSARGKGRLQLGVEHWRGFFFLHPIVCKKRDVQSGTGHCMCLLALANDGPLTIPYVFLWWCHGVDIVELLRISYTQ